MRNSRFNRRSILRGMIGGGTVAVSLPLLDAFLDGNGTALADGVAMPTRFGTFFWGLGLSPGRWVPSKAGANYDVPAHFKFLEGGLDKKTSIFSGFTAILDGRASHPHWTGMAAILTGNSPLKVNSFDNMPSFDVKVAEAIGGKTRFRTIEATPYANGRSSYSSSGGDNFKPADDSPLALYTRLFGPGFKDPNSADWTPDPKVMVKKSVLSVVKDQRDALMAEAGASDKVRLDQYFTSVRELEQKLDNELTKPAPCEACVVPTAPEALARKGDVPTIMRNNEMMSKLVAMALACNQSNVVNYVFTNATSEIYRPGDTPVFHAHTHEEPVNTKLGYQPISNELSQYSVDAFGVFLKALDEIKEGDGTLLDHSLMLGFSDTGWAKIHSIDSIPVLLSGGGNGKHKAGQHIVSGAEPVTRISLTVQQMLGLPVGSFGTQSMTTSKPLTEVMA